MEGSWKRFLSIPIKLRLGETLAYNLARIGSSGANLQYTPTYKSDLCL